MLNGLRRGLGPLAACFLGLGVLGFDPGSLAMLGLPPCRLPLADLPETLGILAVALVPTPRQVRSAAPFAQADSWPRSAPPG
jgi:hypothetical protein